MSYYDIGKAGFEVGMRVRVIRQRSYKKFMLVDMSGTVESNLGYGSVAVSLDGIKNNYSSRGVFYFPPSDLAIIDENDDLKNVGGTNMSKEKITNYLNTANVRFVNGTDPGLYSYANFDETLGEGDLCAVVTENGCFRMARVIEIVNDNDRETYREVIAKINTEAYDVRVERRSKAAELKAKMEERAKQLRDIALYQLLAKDDSAMMDLLNEYQSLNKV